jgi:uncharacterized iron-regulated protein
MMKMKTIFGLIVLSMFLSGTCINADAVPKILRVMDKQTVNYKVFIEDIESSEVIFIGETHDDAKQHENQLEIIKSLETGNAPLAIGLEMFSTDSQKQLDDWSKGNLEEETFKTIFAGNWSYDWWLYRDIFIFARDNHIPMIALNLPKPIMSKVVKQGASALNDEDKKEMPENITWALNPPQTDYLRRITSQVFGIRLGEAAFSHFIDAQVLRNSEIAWRISKYKEKYPKNKIVVITGTWHAIKNGAPEQLRQYGRLKYTVILPELPEFVIQNVTTDDADYFILK